MRLLYISRLSLLSSVIVVPEFVVFVCVAVVAAVVLGAGRGGSTADELLQHVYLHACEGQLDDGTVPVAVRHAV